MVYNTVHLNHHIMINVTIQVKTQVNWENCTKVNHTFKTWENCSIFAYRLAKQSSKEIRVESKGNGHYYAPHNADTYLNESLNLKPLVRL